MPFEPAVSFIGAGNLAWHLAPAFDNSGYVVKEVFSQNHKHAEALADQLYQAEVKTTLDFSYSASRIFIVAVSDGAINEVAQEIILPENSLLVHTSGAVPMDELKYAAAAASGVFYPLQTFSKNRKADFKGLPIFVEANEPEAEELLFEMGRSLGANMQKMDTHQRAALHLAAVFASNFTNHMITVAWQLAQANHISFEWMKPLVRETIDKNLSIGPMHSQTGPAKRGDLETLDKHFDMLKDDEKISEIYRLLSQHIMDTHEPE